MRKTLLCFCVWALPLMVGAKSVAGDLLRDLDESLYLESDNGFYRADLSGSLAKLRDRLMIVAPVKDLPGERGVDQGTMRRMWEAQLSGAPNAEVRYIEGASTLVTEERPEELDRIVAKFLEDAGE